MIDNEKSTSIEGFTLNEENVSVAKLAEFTHKKFHNTIDVLVESNTPRGIFDLLIGEVNELLEVIEKDPENRVSMVAELGDLFHFWNDLFQLTNASVSTLLNSLNLDDVGEEKLSVARVRNAAVVDQESKIMDDDQINARDMLYSLRGILRLGASEDIDAETVGVIASHIFAVSADLDINIVYAVLMKNLRNRKKYDSVKMNALFSEGKDYTNIRSQMVEKWLNGLGGDEKFFKEFLTDFPIEMSHVVAGQLATD